MSLVGPVKLRDEALHLGCTQPWAMGMGIGEAIAGQVDRPVQRAARPAKALGACNRCQLAIHESAAFCDALLVVGRGSSRPLQRRDLAGLAVALKQRAAVLMIRAAPHARF